MGKENKSVVVIGEAKCGMTTLLKKLSDGRWVGTPDTICPAHYRNNDVDLSMQLIELNNYTKGRQYLIDMYTNMAQVVMIIKDCSTSDNSTKMLQHVERIRKLRPSVPIVLVTTKCDEGPLRKSDDGYSLFSHISTSCKTDLGIADLKKALFRAAFPTEMRDSEKWYRPLLNWQGFEFVSNLRSNTNKSTKNVSRVQKKTTPAVPRKALSTQSLNASLNRPALNIPKPVSRSLSMRQIR